MKILGIANNDQAGACIVANNVVIAAATEERFSRVKDHKIWPQKSIDYVLKEFNGTLSDIDYIAYGWCAGFSAEKHLLLYFDRISEETIKNSSSLSHLRKRISDEINHDKKQRFEFDSFIEKNNLKEKAIYIDHHECHALGAFICSAFERSLVITCDGRGDFQSFTVSLFTEKGFDVLQRETSIDSLGYFYGRITKLLGFVPNRHEGKITGLAAYGDPLKHLDLMKKMIDLEGESLRSKCGIFYQPSYHSYSPEIEEMIKTLKPEDVAAAAQLHIEQLITKIVAIHIKKIGSIDVCLSGGVFGNVKLNQRISEVAGVKQIYILPCMGDGGLPLAAAVAVPYLKDRSKVKVPTMLLGPSSGNTEKNIAFLQEMYPKLTYIKPNHIHAAIVDLLKQDQVIGLFRGRMEFGPRALCNRSIIYHCKDKNVNDWLNKRMHRTEFMPFAPVVAEEFANRCFKNWKPDDTAAEYMTITYDCLPNFELNCPAVVHFDSTARPQIVYKEKDPFMYQLLLEWYRSSDQLALINTSFNKHEEPIVCDAKNAFDAVNEGMVDCIIMNEEVVIYAKEKRFSN